MSAEQESPLFIEKQLLDMSALTINCFLFACIFVFRFDHNNIIEPKVRNWFRRLPPSEEAPPFHFGVRVNT